MQGIKNTVVLPHQFEDQTENTIVAICKVLLTEILILGLLWSSFAISNIFPVLCKNDLVNCWCRKGRKN